MRLSKTIGGKQQNNNTYKVIIIEVKVGKKQILFNQKYCSNSETKKIQKSVSFSFHTLEYHKLPHYQQLVGK